MASPLYYIADPGFNPGNRKDLADAGLAHLVGLPMGKALVGKGPDNGRGCVFGQSEKGTIGYKAETQTWRQMPGLQVWFGFTTDDRPSPGDLQRKDALRGHAVALLDGNDWTVPIARGLLSDDGGETITPYIALPGCSEYNAQGEWVPSGVVPKYTRLWELAEAWVDAQTAIANDEKPSPPDGVSFEFVGVHEIAVEVLACNYHVSAAEVGALGLLGEHAAYEILLALTDIPTLMAWDEQKKTEAVPDGSPTADGGQA